MEFVVFILISLIVGVLLHKLGNFDSEMLPVSVLLGVMVGSIFILVGLLMPQSDITTVTEIQYSSMEISDDNEYLFVVNENNKEVIANFEIKFVDKTDNNYGKLVKTVVKSDENKFPNVILVSTQLESEKYVYYTNLK